MNADGLSEKDKERLKMRLEIDSDKIRNRFATLVDKARESLESQKVTCSDLSVLVRHSTKNKLFHLTKKSRSIRKLFLTIGLSLIMNF